MNQQLEKVLKTFSYYLIGFLVLAVTHEYIHVFVAKRFDCSNIVMHWIPTADSLFRVTYDSCSNYDTLKVLQTMVEIVGYHLYALYTAICSFIILKDSD